MSITKNQYREILYQVILLEKSRWDISQSILQTKNRKERYKLMISFLYLDLKKHKLFEHAAQAAVQVDDQNVMNSLRKFYYHINKSDSILVTIQDEIDTTCKLISAMQKSLDRLSDMTFYEKRVTQETEKYILTRARYQQK